MTAQRIALLGAGYISTWHAKAIKTIPNLILQTVCDQSSSHANQLAEQFGIKQIYNSVSEMARDTSVDSVHVLLPPDLHFPYAKELLLAGKNVFLEKPMGVSFEECQELTDIAKDQNLRVGVGHNFLFHPRYEQLRSDLKAGKLGWVDRIEIHWHKELPQLRHGPFGIWMLREPGNIVLETGAHLFAYLLDLFGAPISTEVIHGLTRQLPSGVVIPQQWSMHCHYEKLHAILIMSANPGFAEHSIHVRGSLGSATADLENNTYVLRRHTPFMDDIDRYARSRNEGKELARQGFAGIRNYVLSKFSKRIPGSVYGLSIAKAIESFYNSSNDSRTSGEFGCSVISQCVNTIRLSRIDLTKKTIPPQAATSIKHPAATILVLGSTGFIGQSLCRTLMAQGHSIRVLVRDALKLPEDIRNSSIEIVKGDLQNRKDLINSLNGIEHVYHLARPMVKTWDDFQKQEIDVTMEIAKACVNAKVKRLYYTGTIDSLYAGGKAGVIREDTPLDPNIANRNLYARAKAISETQLLAMQRKEGLPVIIVRPGIVIGRGGSPFHWGIGMWHFGSVCQVWGNGENKLPLVLVDDVSIGLTKLMNPNVMPGQILQLVGDPCLNAREYLDELEKHASIKLQRQYVLPWRFYLNDMGKWIVKTLVRHPERRLPSYFDWESRTQKAFFDCSETKRILDWQPTSDRNSIIQDGIVAAIEEFRR
jgi:predicted dehydrogenase/nucleoside-diphosphate-sugar epimerase